MYDEQDERWKREVEVKRIHNRDLDIGWDRHIWFWTSVVGLIFIVLATVFLGPFGFVGSLAIVGFIVKSWLKSKWDGM